MLIITSKNFDKKFKKLSRKVQLHAKNRIALFISNQFDVRLNNHLLHSEKKLLRSINITGDLRLVYEEIDEDVARFLDLDTHSNLYS